jgi:hypothetical protein
VIGFFLIVTLVATALILPGWFWAKRQQSQTPWVLFLPVSGVGFWFVLVMLRIGPQSLSNLIEIPIVAIIAVAVAYLKIFAIDKQLKKSTYGEIIAYAIVASVTLGLRLFMPLLPE